MAVIEDYILNTQAALLKKKKNYILIRTLVVVTACRHRILVALRDCDVLPSIRHQARTSRHTIGA